MNKSELLKRMKSPDADMEYIKEMQEQLSEELKKPVEEQDFDLIDDLNEAIAVMNGTNETIQRISENGLAQFKRKNMDHRSKGRRSMKYAVLCGCIVFFALSNIWSFSALGIDAVSAVFRFWKGGVSISFPNAEETSHISDSLKEAATDNTYAEKMQTICAANNINAILPKYIPDGFEPTEEFGLYDTGDIADYLVFYFKRDSVKINYMIIQNHNEEPEEVGIPSDDHHISELKIGQTTVVVSKEDQQYHAVFQVDQLQYHLSAYGLDYEECNKILNSISLP